MTVLKDVNWSGGEWNPAVFAVGGTAFVVVIAFVAVFVFMRKNRLNWYERNLLEIAESQPQYIRYKLNRSDTDVTLGTIHSEPESEDHSPTGTHAHPHKPFAIRGQLAKQQSRIYAEEDRSKKISADIPANIDEKFVVPKSKSVGAGISMFQKLEKGQIDKDLYDVRQDSSASEEQVVGECGSLKMALSFDAKLSLLTVQLRQAADLMTQRPDGPPNPYFKVTLQKPEPNPHPYMQQSKVYRQTRAPEMNDEFYFDVPVGLLGECKLEVLVFDFDQGSVDEVIGYCWLTLCRLEISTDTACPTVFWAEVLPVSAPGSNFGEVLFSVAYLAKAQRLTVSIFKARKLVQSAEVPGGLPDPAIRVTISCGGKRLKRKKTSSKKATLHPTYNEALTFSIPKNSLCDIVLDLEVIHDPGYLVGALGGAHRVLGQLELPLHKCKDLWRAIIKGDNSKSRWYALEKPFGQPSM